MTQHSDKGTFTQLPNVLLDTFDDLPESALIGFIRLVRHYGHRGVFAGSIRKLAKTIRMSKSTTARIIPTWEQAGLVSKSSHPKEDEERDEMVLIIHMADLWQRNIAHANQCPKLGQSIQDTISVPNWDKVVPELDNTVPQRDESVPNWDEFVPLASTNHARNTNKTIKTSNTKKDSFGEPSVNGCAPQDEFSDSHRIQETQIGEVNEETDDVGRDRIAHTGQATMESDEADGVLLGGNPVEQGLDDLSWEPMDIGNDEVDPFADTVKREAIVLSKQEESEHCANATDHLHLHTPDPSGAEFPDGTPGMDAATQIQTLDVAQSTPAPSPSNSQQGGQPSHEGVASQGSASTVPTNTTGSPQEQCTPAEAPYETTEEWDAARREFLEGVRTTWGAFTKQEKTAHGGKWQTYEKEQRLAWEKKYPRPVDKALEEACRAIYKKLTTELRGYVWNEEGAIRNERLFVKNFVLKYRREYPDPVQLFEDIYTHLTTVHIKWSSVSYCTQVSALVVYHEAPGVIQLWKNPPKQANGRQSYNGSNGNGTNIVTINGKQRKVYSNGLAEFDLDSLGMTTYAAQSL